MRILLQTASRIGDAVLSTGLLSPLIERHPDARLAAARRSHLKARLER